MGIRVPNLPLASDVDYIIGIDENGSTVRVAKDDVPPVTNDLTVNGMHIWTNHQSNTFFGYNSGANNVVPTGPGHSGDLNTYFGSAAGQSNTTGFAQTFIGSGAGAGATTGDSNTYIGCQAGLSGTTAKWNIGIGVDALFANLYGRDNTIIGHHAGTTCAFADNTGECTVVGAEAFRGVGGIQCSIFGYRAGYNINATGTQNSMFGALAGFSTTSGARNSFFGRNAGFSNVTGDGNIFLGSYAGYFETGSSKLIIDNDTRTNEATARLQALVYGVMGSVASQYFQVNGGFVVGNGALPSGGYKGAGSINAHSVYDDNVLLTCFGIEYLIDGKVDLAKWDGVAPIKGGRRHHTLAHDFVALAERFDPRDYRDYLRYMRETRSMPGMPTFDDWRHGELSIGEMVNRTWLSGELLLSAFSGHVEFVESELNRLRQDNIELRKRVERLEAAA